MESENLFTKVCKCGNKIVVTGWRVSIKEYEITTDVNGIYSAGMRGDKGLTCNCGRRYQMESRKMIFQNRLYTDSE